MVCNGSLAFRKKKAIAPQSEIANNGDVHDYFFGVLNLVVNVPRVLFKSAYGYDSEIPLWHQVIVIIACALALSVAWAQFELAIAEKRQRTV